MHWISEACSTLAFGSAVLRTDRRTMCNPLANMDYLCTESARLLDQGPSVWLQSLYREQAIDAARQLHQDMCLMTTNLNILDQYVLCLQGMASKILELSQVPGTFHRWQWLRVPWAPGSSLTYPLTLRDYSYN